MHHELFGLLQQVVQAVLDVARQQVGRARTQWVEGKRLMHLLRVSCV